MAGIKLVTRADDAGLNLTSNKAIRASVRQGIVQNVSLLAPGPYIEHAAETLGDLDGQVDFGLHLCLTAEWANLRWGAVSDPKNVTSVLRGDLTFPATCDELSAGSPIIEEMMIEVDHPRWGKAKQIGFPIKFSDTPWELRIPAARLGDHTDEALSELGYSMEDIEKLRQERVIC